MASTPVYEISRLRLLELETPSSASITDVKLLSSYNWIEAPRATPTIAVPGSPALWSASRESSRPLRKDSGFVFIAQNAARHPDSPLEPLFRALYVAHPSFDIRSTDVVTDRNNVRKLLSFVDPSTAKKGIEAFTMKIEMTKNTAIFCREETKTSDYISPWEFKGFGHSFEKAYTVDQISGSTGHHRIISYRFGGLSFILRHETDGYVKTDARTSTPGANQHIQDELSNILESLSLSSFSSAPGITSTASKSAIKTGGQKRRAKQHAQDGLSSKLNAMSSSSANSPPSVTLTGSKLVIKEEGQMISLESTLEIKTRVSHKHLPIEEVASQLWVSQTPRLVRAYHHKGIFKKPVVEDVAAEIKDWEERKQNELQRLAALIREIISLVHECGGSAVLKYNVEADKLVISKVGRKDMLPKDLYLKWDDEPEVEAKADIQDDDGKEGSKAREAEAATGTK